MLTAGHVINEIYRRVSNSKTDKIEGYVRQALNDGKHVGTYRIIPGSIRLSRAFQNNIDISKDYALFEVEPIEEVKK